MRTRIYVGRTDYFSYLDAVCVVVVVIVVFVVVKILFLTLYVTLCLFQCLSDGGAPIILLGPSGIGHSTIIANWVRERIRIRSSVRIQR